MELRSLDLHSKHLLTELSPQPQMLLRNLCPTYTLMYIYWCLFSIYSVYAIFAKSARNQERTPNNNCVSLYLCSSYAIYIHKKIKMSTTIPSVFPNPGLNLHKSILDINFIMQSYNFISLAFIPLFRYLFFTTWN